MSRSQVPLGSLALAGCLLAAGAAPALAGVDVDFGASVRVGDHADLFFSISSRYFDRDRPVVETWGRRFTHPDDLAVFLFVVQRSGRTPEQVWALRREGLSWWELSARVGIPVDAWFLPVERDPGPPYGKAYGHWKKHRRRARAFRLSDPDVRNLVAVRMIHEYYGVHVEIAMELRASGHDVRSLAVEEYWKRRGKPMSASREKPVPRGADRRKDSHRARKEDRHPR